MRHAVVAAGCLLLLGAACTRSDDGKNGNTGGASKGAPLFTRADEIDNERLIAWLKSMVDANPAAGGRMRLVNIYLKRGQMRGRLDDFDRCIEYATKDIDGTHASESYKTRARCEISLHRFHDAAADLDAAAHHADALPQETLGLRGDVAWALGKYDEALDDYKKAQRADDAIAMVRLANFDVELGALPDADLLFDGAEKLVAGKDKNYEAWLQVQRAIRHLESGEIPEARARIDKALAHDEKNVLAELYHAQILSLDGKPADAIAEYETLVAKTDNPEYMSALALLKAKNGDAPGAAKLVEAARQRYTADVRAFPEALWQHDGQFLLDQRIEPATALEVLTKNADARPNVQSWIPLAWAQLANGDAKAAKATVDRALATPSKSARLWWVAAHVAEANGDAGTAKKMRTRALAANPRIADLVAHTTPPAKLN